MRNDYFNSRPSARGDNTTNSCVSLVVEFQFTPLREGRRCKRNKTSSTMRFQFTPLREGRPSRSYSGACALRFQFTPLREGRRACVQTQRRLQTISIHAPPRGATSTASWLSWLTYFNSRPSARGDGSTERKAESACISIHAPPRGATHVQQHRAVSIAISIHAPPRGATWCPA